MVEIWFKEWKKVLSDDTRRKKNGLLSKAQFVEAL
jgi:hypothetical protein